MHETRAGVAQLVVGALLTRDLAELDMNGSQSQVRGAPVLAPEVSDGLPKCVHETVGGVEQKAGRLLRVDDMFRAAATALLWLGDRLDC